MKKPKVTIRLSSQKDDFVGAKVNDDGVIITFPYGYDIEEGEYTEQNKADVITLLKVLSLARIDCDKDSDGKDEDNFSTLNAIWLIENYLDNGYYIETETNYKKNGKGIIDFKKTIKNIIPFYHKGDLVYTQFINKNNYVNNDYIITEIQKWCLYESVEVLGMLFNDIKIEKPSIVFNKLFFIQVLKSHLNTSFIDSKKLLLRNLIDFIEGCSESSLPSNKIEIGTNQFHTVYETLIFKAFNNVDIKDYYPSTNYYFVDDNSVKKNSVIRPDTIIDDNNELYILDAKYYRHGIINEYSLPGSSDVFKQIQYGKYNSSRFKNKKVYNAFIIPFKKTTAGAVQFKGFGYRVGEHNNDLPYGRVAIIMFDMKTLFDVYLDSNPKITSKLKTEIHRVMEVELIL